MHLLLGQGPSRSGRRHSRQRQAVFTTVAPSYAEVLEVRAGRVAMVRDFLATITPDVLAEPRKDPYDPGRPETVRSCLHVILGE